MVHPHHQQVGHPLVIMTVHLHSTSASHTETNLCGLGGKHREVSPISGLELSLRKISQLDVDPSYSLNVCAILCKQPFMTASLLLTMYATEYCWIENFPWIDPSVTKPTLTWLIPLRMPLVPILPGPSMAEEAATPRQWWLAHHTALFSQTLSTSVRRPSLLSKCTQAGDIETRFIQKYIGDLYIYRIFW